VVAAGVVLLVALVHNQRKRWPTREASHSSPPRLPGIRDLQRS
jgi:hypothetical protein